MIDTPKEKQGKHYWGHWRHHLVVKRYLERTKARDSRARSVRRRSTQP